MIRCTKMWPIVIMAISLKMPCFAQTLSPEICDNTDSAKSILAKQHADLEAITKVGYAYDADAEVRLKAKMQAVASRGNGGKEQVAKITAQHMARYQTEAMSLLQKQIAILAAEGKAEKSGDLRSACAYSLEIRQQMQVNLAAHKTYYEGLIKALDATMTR